MVLLMLLRSTLGHAVHLASVTRFSFHLCVFVPKYQLLGCPGPLFSLMFFYPHLSRVMLILKVVDNNYLIIIPLNRSSPQGPRGASLIKCIIHLGKPSQGKTSPASRLYDQLYAISTAADSNIKSIHNTAYYHRFPCQGTSF
jgi:hypothetical protein